MASIKDITSLCKAGKLIEGYTLAKQEYEKEPSNVWAQRGLGWALYYVIREDVELRKKDDFFSHMNQLADLGELSVESDSMIFDSLFWKLAEFVKMEPKDNPYNVDKLFNIISKYKFKPSTSYSYFLKCVMGFESWYRLVDFFEWWNIDNLMPEDYNKFTMDNGKKIMSLAEQAYIAYAKALLGRNDREKIAAFLPKIEHLTNTYPDMMYPGYYCGRLMLSMGCNREDALGSVLPFVRKKKTEFWVWKLLADIHQGESDIQLACLQRAVHCKTEEAFIGKVRIALAQECIKRNDYARAKFHIDKVTQCYMSNGWRLPGEIQTWISEGWLKTIKNSDSTDAIDYKTITDRLLADGANYSIAAITYVDQQRKKVSIIYGEKKRASVSMAVFPIKVYEGGLFKISWIPTEKGINIITAAKCGRDSIESLNYMMQVKGKISKAENQDFAFISSKDVRAFVGPSKVNSYNLKNGEEVSAVLVLDYNSKKEQWNWVCLSIKR